MLIKCANVGLGKLPFHEKGFQLSLACKMGNLHNIQLNINVSANQLSIYRVKSWQAAPEAEPSHHAMSLLFPSHLLWLVSWSLTQSGKMGDDARNVIHKLHTVDSSILFWLTTLPHDQLDLQNFYIKGILPKGPYLLCVSMAGRALFAGYHRYHILTFRVFFQSI